MYLTYVFTLPPFVRITGIRFYGYNLSPQFFRHPLVFRQDKCIDLKIQVGDSVKQGDALLILEAMKMENILKSPGEGVVKNLKVKKGDSVEKGQVLVEF
jgi:biotin carboxyl carrier protein